MLTVLPGGPPATIVLDYGREVGGVPFMTVSAVATGTSATMYQAFSEALGFLITQPLAYTSDHGGVITQNVAAAGALLGDLRGGFRFHAIRLATPGSVTLSSAGVVFKAYQATPDKYQGTFLSSDDKLNRIWSGGACTTQMNMVPAGVSPDFNVPVIFDGAKRDRAVWSGDLEIQGPVVLLSLGTNGAPYVKGSVQQLIAQQNADGSLPSAVGFLNIGRFNYANTFSAYTALAAIDYYRYTRDTPFVTQILPNLERATAYHATLLGANGLVVSNDPDYWQTRQDGEVAEYSMVYYELLKEMAWLESRVGTAAKAADYTTKAAALAAAINSRLWNESVGAYQHSNLRPDVFPLDANANAVRLGVTPAGKVQGILDFLKGGWTPHGALISQPAPSLADPVGHAIHPFNHKMEIDARFHAGDSAGALDLMHRLWDQMIDPNGPYYTGTFWELLLQDGRISRGFTSLAHGFAAGPTQQLTEYILGIRPVEPGYQTWLVQPYPSGLAWARGHVPTAYGTLSVEWTMDSTNERLTIEVAAPAGTSGTVGVPASATTLVFVDGTIAWDLEGSQAYGAYRLGDYIFLTGLTGTHEITTSPAGDM
ncbi:MAG: alpha-L-rhamnosidase C-terminal domain-containing protein [Roseiflexaceae bacterium]